MADITPGGQDDTAAIGAYAARYQLEKAAAAADWRFLREGDREHWRGVAERDAAAPTPGRAVYERHHALLRQRFPGIAKITWDELDDEAQDEWEDIARAGIAVALTAGSAAAAERARIRRLADRTHAVCTGDEGTSFYFSALLGDAP